MKYSYLTLISLVLFVLVGCAGSEQSNLLSVADTTLNKWAQESNTPFQKPRYQIISSDGTFATVEILAELRRDINEPWVERRAIVECRNINNVWQCDDRINFSNEDQQVVRATNTAAQATFEIVQTQSAERIATATAQMEEFVENSSGLIAFTAIFQEERDVVFSQLYIYDPVLQEVNNIFETDAFVAGVSWSPNAQKIVFMVEQDYSGQVFIIDVATREIMQISRPNESAGWAQWSPDGSKIVYAVGQLGADTKIVVASADGSGHQELVHDTEQPIGIPQWSPQGDAISFQEMADGHPVLYVIDSDGRNMRKIPLKFDSYFSEQNSLVIMSRDWSPDGRQVSLLVYDYSQESLGKSFIVNIENGELELITKPSDEILVQGWSPDGSGLYVNLPQSANNISPGFYIVSTNFEEYTLLAEGSTNYFFDPSQPKECSISPDGSQLLVVDDSGYPRVIDMNTKQLTYFTNIMAGVGDFNSAINVKVDELGSGENMRVDLYSVCWSP